MSGSVETQRRLLTAGTRLLRGRLTGGRFPLLVSWTLTTRCNLACPHCGLWSQRVDELSTETCLAALSDMAQMGTFAVSLIGGETLLREDLSKLLQACRRLGIKNRVTSNGTLVTTFPERLDGVDILKLSLDGPEEVHRKTRGSGVFDKVIEAALWAQGRGIRVVFNTVLSGFLVPHLGELMDIGRMMSIPITFQPLEYRGGRDWEDIPGFLPNKRQFETMIYRIMAVKRSDPQRVGNSFYGLKTMLTWPQPPDIDCFSGQFFCRISPNGEVSACDRVSMGHRPNIHGTRFVDAFAKLEKVNACDGCWRNNTLDITQALKPDPKALLTLAKNYL